MVKKLFVLLSIFVLAALIVSPAAAGMGGSGVTGVQIQNLNSGSASVTVQLYPQAGGSPISLTQTPVSINGLAATNFYLPSFSNVTSGAYSMVVSSNLPVAAIARTDWASTGGAAIYESTDPASDVTVPLVFKSYGNQTSQVTIQNTNTSADITDVVIKVYGRGLAAAVVTTPAQTIAKGASKTFILSDALFGTLPNTALDLGQTGFVGSMKITSATPVVVQSYMDVAGSPAVSGFSGVATSSASADLYCPLIRANYYGDTGISIVNPTGASVDATITFYPDAASPNKGQASWVQNLTVGANSMQAAFQGPTGNSRSAPTNLPGGTQTGSNPTPTNDGFYGVAKIHATGNVLAVVNDTKFGAGWAVKSQSTYNCKPQADAGTKFALPLLRRYHIATTKLTTGIQIQNTSNATITVHLDLTDWNGTSRTGSNPTDIQIGPWGSGNWWSGNLTGLPTVPPDAGGSGWYGSGIVTITGGTAVLVVDDAGFGSVAVDSADYNALKIQ